MRMYKYEIRFRGCIARETVETMLTPAEIRNQLLDGWLNIGNMVINASMVEAVIEVGQEEESEKE